MVQIIKERRKPSLASAIGEGLGQGLATAGQMYAGYQKKKGEEQQYHQENETYKQLTGRNLSRNSKIREMEIEYALKGQNEAQSFRNKLLGQKEEQKQVGQSFQKLQNIYHDPNLSDEEKTFAVYQEFSQNPQLANSLVGALQQQRGIGEEESYLNQVMGGGRAPQDFEIPSDMEPEDAFGRGSELGIEPAERNTTKRAPKRPKFDSKDPSTWTDKQVNQLRAVEGKTAKSKTLARLAQNEFDSRQETKKAKQKYEETVAPLESALQTITSMEKLGKGGRLGIGTKVRGIVSPQTRKDAATYERLGKSLIQYSTNIPIRNRQEFETLAHDLYDPSISDDARAGILSAMKQIIQNSMQSIMAPEEEATVQPPGKAPARGPASKERPPLTSFLR